MANQVKFMAEAIINAHGGQAYFNMTEAHKIVGCGINTIAHELHNAGITVKKIGPSKRVSAYDLAEFMCSGRIAPIDNTPKRA